MIYQMLRRAAPAAALLIALGAPLRGQDSTAADRLVRYRIQPSAVDSHVSRFDEPHYVVFDPAGPADAPLLVFLPGTGGRPSNTTDFADLAARQGYRVIGLQYVDTPAVEQVCPRDPDPNCAEHVRRKRIYGDNPTSLINDRPEESIVYRLTKLLEALDARHPNEGWGRYLVKGEPDWTRIAVSGLSQGAGMAAFIAQHTLVARAILFSSPWDNSVRTRSLAPWISRGHGATPSERWFGAYHRDENTANLIARAYSMLGIPTDHIHVFTLPPARSSGPNPNHASVVGNFVTPRLPDGSPAYLEEWRAMLGDMRHP
jgi:dienelactone hydrolase